MEIELEIELSRYWAKFCKRPFCEEEVTFTMFSHPYMAAKMFREVRGFLLFLRKRTLLIDKNWNCIGSMETRNARLLINEANKNGWIKEERKSYKLPFNLEDYPDMCDGVIIIEAPSKNLSVNKI